MINIGLIGTGTIGKQHLERLHKDIYTNIAKVIGVYSPNSGPFVAKQFGIKAYYSSEELISSDEINAVIICSADEFHYEQVKLCLKYNKPVLCEKPLSQSLDESLDLIKIEQELGKRLISLGFMRRFDPYYIQLKKSIQNKKFGEMLLIHCKHRTTFPPPNSNPSTNAHVSLVHEFDILRWMTNEEFKSVKVYVPNKSAKAGEKLQDPQFFILKSSTDRLYTIESFLSAGYGYDVQCEIVAEEGTYSMPNQVDLLLSTNLNIGHKLPYDWNERFSQAYDDEIRTWILSLYTSNKTDLANAWDGYLTTYIAS